MNLTKLTSPSLSRKWRMSLIGLGGLIAIYAASLATLIYKPDVSVYITPLAQIIVVAWSGIVVAYVGMQGLVDSKTQPVINPAAPIYPTANVPVYMPRETPLPPIG